MEYRRLGRTDLKVSVICLGTMTWGEQNTEAEGHAQMDYAIEQGVNFFDTAEIYGPFTNETLVGKGLKPFRNKVNIATKFGLTGPPNNL